VKYYFLRLLGYVLHTANSGPSFSWKNDFYRLKERLLKKYATTHFSDVQHIKKICWSCDGNVPCHRCINGVYDEFWVLLNRYELGGFIFHIPVCRGNVKPGTTVHIEGYINHRKYANHLSDECFYWLMLFFDFKSFMKYFGIIEHCGRKVTPFVIVGTAIFRLRRRKERVYTFCKNRLQSLKLSVRRSGNFEDDDIPF